MSDEDGKLTTRLLARAFGKPRGVLGRLGGGMMAVGNGETERYLVDTAKITTGDTVLVLGPGPGIGLCAAGERAALTIGVDPSADMLAMCRRRCGELLRADRVRLRTGTAADTGQEPGSVDVVLTANSAQLWPDRPAAFAELLRVLRPGGRLLLSAHERWLPLPRHEIAAEAEAAGFTDLQTWTWDPPGGRASTAALLRGLRPGSPG